MEGSIRLFLLVLGLCLVTVSVNSTTESGDESNNANEDVMMKLEKHRAEREKLIQQLEAAEENKEQQDRIQKDLDDVISAINRLEVQFRVVYREHLEAIARKTGGFEDVKNALQKELEDAGKSHAEAAAKLEAANKEDQQQIEIYQKELEKWAKEKGRIGKEYAALTELQYERQERAAEEKEQLDKMKDEMIVRMKRAQNQNAGIPVYIPRENEIEEIMKIVSKYANMENTATKTSGLLVAHRKLKLLYQTLFEELELPRKRPLKDMKDELVMIELYTRSTLVKKIFEKNDLLDELSKKEFGDYKEEEIQTLQRINQDLSVTEKYLKEINLRISCLMAIREVSNLLEDRTPEVDQVLEPPKIP